MDAQVPSRAKWLPQLDSLRALAALAVLTAHYYPGSGLPYDYEGPFFPTVHLLSLPNLGVAFFFSLSAFLLAYLAAKQGSQFRVGPFYRRRAARIWPLYFVAIAMGLAGLSSEAWASVSNYIAYFVLFLPNWLLALHGISTDTCSVPHELQVLWSIGVEEQAYLLFPFLFLYCVGSRRRTATALVVLLSVGLCFRWFVAVEIENPTHSHPSNLYYATFTYCEVFFLGGLFGYLVATDSLPAAFRSRTVLTLCLALLAAVLCVFRFQNPTSGAPSWLQALVAITAYPIFGFAASVLIAWACTSEHSYVARLLRNPLLRVLGVLSFGLYVWHVPAIKLIHLLDLSLVDAVFPGPCFLRCYVVFACYLMLCVVLAALGYFLIELPVLNLTRRHSTSAREQTDREMRRSIFWIAGGAAIMLACCVLVACAWPGWQRLVMIW